ncbi:transmembrane alpha-helix domain-containing protein [Rutstroemia sp. NJR-2017a WRK4]|nr:transmembrane alpha-helix domain-containing protein [Rutstroemia sp. NJR-2017a WRK4]
MTRLRWLYAGIAASIFTLTLAADASSTCWYPDGATAEPGHVPCNQTISGASACCDPDDSCTTSGMCLGASGWVYRGSCTDSNWESGNCANQFPNCTTEPTSGRRYHTWTALWACSPLGLPLSEYCCGYANGASCCPSKFTLGVTGQAFKPGDDQRVKNISAAAIAQYTSTRTASAVSSSTSSPATASAACSAASAIAAASPTPSVCPDPELGTKLGLGIGVPLGVLAAGILGLLFWREANRGRMKGVQDDRNVNAGYATQQQHLGNGNGHRNGYDQDPMKNQWVPGAVPLFEAPPNHLLAELKA